LANKKTDLSIQYYCANALRPHIDDLAKSAERILKRRDMEDIHDLRVASRRIRAVLDAFDDCLPKKQLKKWKNDVRSITKSYGKVRDIDVQLDLINEVYSEAEDKKIKSGLRRIRLRLEQKRKANQEKTAKKAGLLLKSSVIIDISNWVQTILSVGYGDIEYSPELFQLGYKQIQSRLDEFLFYEVFIFDKNRVEELHSMRISAKKLRYSLEVFSDLYQHETDFALAVTKETQDYLGDIHDCDVWVEFLPKFMEKEYKRIKEFYGYTRPYHRIKPGLEYLISNRKTKRQELYAAFIQDWKEWKLKETWLNLRKVIFLTSLETQSQPTQNDISEDLEPEN